MGREEFLLMAYNGYKGTGKYSEEVQCYCGKVLGVNGAILFEGNTLDEMYHDFINAVDEYISLNNKPQKLFIDGMAELLDCTPLELLQKTI